MVNISMRSGQPQIEIVITARTAKKTLLRRIAADESGASDTTLEVDNSVKTMPAIPRGPSIAGPKATNIVPSTFADAAAEYFGTSPVIDVADTALKQKIEDALRKAENPWGWSHVLKNVKRIAMPASRWLGGVTFKLSIL